jgi:hypothetical protein
MSETLRVIIEDDEGGASSSSHADRVAEAERKTAHWNAEAARYRQEAAHIRFVTDRNNVDSLLRAVNTEAQTARAAYQDALDRGESERAADAVAKISEIESRRRELQQHEQALARVPTPRSDPKRLPEKALLDHYQ